MAVLQSLEELEALLDDRPEVTRTYQVDPSIAAEMLEAIRSLDSGVKVRQMTAPEVAELAQYLSISVEEFSGPLTVSDIGCSGCGRRFTILDIAKTAVDDGLHAKALLAAVLTGKAGTWVTVRGKDGGRYANCSACGLRSEVPIDAYSTDACPVAYVWA
jgi:hypothetical protein